MIPRVLVVTSNLPLGDVLQDRFQQAGIQALASPLESALERIAHWGQPDVVVWDIPAAPAEDAGTAAAELLKELGSPRAMLLLGLPGTVPWELPGGTLLAKPVDFETLLDAVQQFLADPRLEANARVARTPLRGLGAEVALDGDTRSRQGARVRILDLGGLVFESPTDYPTDAQVMLWLPVPGETLRLRLSAEVRWCHREGGKSLVGCRFASVASADLARLERILAAHAP